MSKSATPSTFRKARRAGWFVVEIPNNADTVWLDVEKTVAKFSTGKYMLWYNNPSLHSNYGNHRILGKLAFKEKVDAMWANLNFG